MRGEEVARPLAASPRQSYDHWAQYYDAIYHGLVDYEGDVDFLEAVFRRHGGKPRSILDLGSGTGNHDFSLVRRGYEVTGIDRSARMVARARQKAKETKPRPRFEVAQMQSFRLGRTFDAAICMFGAFDYLVRPGDAARCLRNLHSHLAPGGLFVYEYWQGSGVRPGLRSWIQRTHSGRVILRFDESHLIGTGPRLEMDFHFLVLRGRKVLDRFTERHIVRTYTRREMGSLLRRAGFLRVGEFAGTPGRKSFSPVTEKTFRIMSVARAK